MRIKLIQLAFSLSFLLTGTMAFSQSVGINEDGSDPDASAILDVSSTTKGFLTPRMTTSERTTIASPTAGLIVYDTDYSGYWFYNGTVWQMMDLITTGSTTGEVPSNPTTGQFYFDTAGEKLYVYVSTGWAEVTLGTPASTIY